MQLKSFQAVPHGWPFGVRDCRSQDRFELAESVALTSQERARELKRGSVVSAPRLGSGDPTARVARGLEGGGYVEIAGDTEPVCERARHDGVPLVEPLRTTGSSSVASPVVSLIERAQNLLGDEAQPI
jgi:hypothetical protein